MGHRNIHCVALLSLLVLVLWPTQGQAAIYGFGGITNNNTGDTNIGESQFTVTVGAYGTNQVLFTFENSGTAASSLTGVYFDDGSLLRMASVINGSGVDFSLGASPLELPGGDLIDPPFVTTVDFLADSNPPTQSNGVNPGESLGIVFTLDPGKTPTDVITAMGLGFTDPGNVESLRIGIHVQGFASGGSESLITVPVPAAVLLGMLGLGAAGLALRKFV